MKGAHLKAVSINPTDIAFQDASMDIWDKKYRLKAKDGAIIDTDIDTTYQRVAKALAEVEQDKDKQVEWHDKFLWALRHGAIPAGRIISNAGALSVMNSRLCAPKALMSLAPAPTLPARCRSWISTTRCALPCHRPVAAAAPKWQLSTSVIQT